jgi:predicted phosphodiesterase
VRIAVISDVHAAFAPFDAALTDARSAGFDQLILLGDLFTYGTEPAACADLTLEAIDKDGALLIGGNHDQLYVDLERQDTGYYDRLPDWIRESVDWTWNCMGRQWPANLNYVEEWSCGDMLMAHANPFGYGDWTYLSNDDLLDRAARTCAQRGYRFGIFGHLHRNRYYSGAGVEVHIIGSVGQPRSNEDRAPQWAMLEMTPGGLTVERHSVAFDPAAHCHAIRMQAGLSDSTKNRLCGYFQ